MDVKTFTPIDLILFLLGKSSSTIISPELVMPDSESLTFKKPFQVPSLKFVEPKTPSNNLLGLE